MKKIIRTVFGSALLLILTACGSQSVLYEGQRAWSAETLRAGGMVIVGVVANSGMNIKEDREGHATMLYKAYQTQRPEYRYVAYRDARLAIGSSVHTQMLDSFAFQGTASSGMLRMAKEKLPIRYWLFANIEGQWITQDVAEKNKKTTFTTTRQIAVKIVVYDAQLSGRVASGWSLADAASASQVTDQPAANLKQNDQYPENLFPSPPSETILLQNIFAKLAQRLPLSK
ncbi:MAG: hypothetical protein H0W44_08755 [Gammaproteobacteria bacterium]|nr:hypothetical protein [Gammaproteobacteria bacterium]